ncbi:MAG: alpha/beta hydrolase, partial [bacterium]|nr:alpha/beta hydrolase [bacterium]
SPYEIPLTKEILTRDFKMQKKLQSDELDVKNVTSEFFLAMNDAMNKLTKMAPEINIPVYTLQAEEDHLIDAEAVRSFFSLLHSNIKEFTVLSKFYHSLSIDKDKEFVYQLIYRWIEKILYLHEGPQVTA